ncbi:redoxin domain-containing protein [Natronomonas sp.]|uniref:redoxin domain-containing protein n=1 Tax=Natronomonas sp. TaxID=2184060 RepID=UPI00260DCDFD|nr:redoxin domain-containing protein [Natronomonas sp.]
MPREGDAAPDISATLGTSDHDPFELSDHLGDGPVVLAFFPAAFAPVCSNEVVVLEEHLDRIREAGATVFGISADAAYSLEAFGDQQGISFDLVSDMSGEALRAYGVEIDIPEQGRYGIADRAVFVLDGDGTVAYRWVAEELVDEPDYEEIIAAVEAA